jgi:hypothetical protein
MQLPLLKATSKTFALARTRGRGRVETRRNIQPFRRIRLPSRWCSIAEPTLSRRLPPDHRPDALSWRNNNFGRKLKAQANIRANICSDCFDNLASMGLRKSSIFPPLTCNRHLGSSSKIIENVARHRRKPSLSACRPGPSYLSEFDNNAEPRAFSPTLSRS